MSDFQKSTVLIVVTFKATIESSTFVKKEMKSFE